MFSVYRSSVLVSVIGRFCQTLSAASRYLFTWRLNFDWKLQERHFNHSSLACVFLFQWLVLKFWLLPLELICGLFSCSSINSAFSLCLSFDLLCNSKKSVCDNLMFLTMHSQGIIYLKFTFFLANGLPDRQPRAGPPGRRTQSKGNRKISRHRNRTCGLWITLPLLHQLS